RDKSSASDGFKKFARRTHLWIQPRGMARSSLAASLLAACFFAARAASADPSTLPPQLIYNYGDNEEARGAALGGAMRALGNGTTAMFLNPADMVETHVYHLSAIAQVTPETGRQAYGGVIVDSITGRLAGGLSVVGGFMDKDGIDRSFIDARLSLAFPITDR